MLLKSNFEFRNARKNRVAHAIIECCSLQRLAGVFAFKGGR